MAVNLRPHEKLECIAYLWKCLFIDYVFAGQTCFHVFCGLNKQLEDHVGYVAFFWWRHDLLTTN
jgi:hypothetical protein